jgi:hypothetical protein
MSFGRGCPFAEPGRFEDGNFAFRQKLRYNNGLVAIPLPVERNARPEP